MDAMMIVTADEGLDGHYVLGVATDGVEVDQVIDADALRGAHPRGGWIVWRQGDDGGWSEVASTTYRYDHEEGRYRHTGWSRKQREELGL